VREHWKQVKSPSDIWLHMCSLFYHPVGIFVS